MEIVEISKDTFPILSEKLKEFFEFRKAKRKPILKESLPSFIKNLEKLSGGVENVAVEILDQSIANGWQGIFELKGHNPTGNNFTSFT